MRYLAPICLAAALNLAAACGDDAPAIPDAGGITTEHCTYVDVPSTARAGGTVSAGALSAGAGEAVLQVPVGTALGGYTARANSAGHASRVDDRERRISGGFVSSVGIETAPRAKAVALTAGDETVVIVKIDAIFVYEGMLFDLEDRLGAEFAGKVLLAASHSHSAWMQYTGHSALKVGGGEFRELVYSRFLDGIEAAARAALDARRPARIGFFVDRNFDPDDQINVDRRTANDGLPGGDRGDDHFVMIRIDGTDGVPIAAVPIFGEHGTLMDDVNPLTSTEASGAIERVLEETLAGSPVVMHLQSAAGDTSPVGHGDADCEIRPGDGDDPCLPFAKVEGHGRTALVTMMAAWTTAGTAMQTELELEMVTRSIPLGPDPSTYTIRDGDLAYAPFDLTRPADGVVFDSSGALVSPIDEFNAPVGAGLCEGTRAMFGAGQMPGTEDIMTYGGCIRLDVAAEVIGALLDLELDVLADRPVCQTTRTNVSALRIGEYLIGTLPGEATVLITDLAKEQSPFDADHTIVVGYAQGHVGYLLRPEDWVLGGYEPTITFWGPLEGEYLVEQLASLMPLATTATREDGAADGTTRVATAMTTDGFRIDDPAPMAGTVPATVDAEAWVRSGPPATAQPTAQVPRISGLATFVWNGDDPAVQMPQITLERETTPGVFTAVTRRSGRPVRDGDFLMTHSPIPLSSDNPRHVYTVEWQPVPWLGALGLDSLADRGGVPLGTYRFHVVGDDWTLDSAPFEVVAGGLEATASRTTTTLTAAVTLHAPKGYRLLDLTAPSNRPVGLRSQDVTVELLDAGAVVLDTRTIATGPSGQLTFDDPDVATATAVRITDRFGNVASVTL